MNRCQASSPVLKPWLLTEGEHANAIIVMPGKFDVIAQPGHQGCGKTTLPDASCFQIIRVEITPNRIHRQP